MLVHTFVCPDNQDFWRRAQWYVNLTHNLGLRMDR